MRNVQEKAQIVRLVLKVLVIIGLDGGGLAKKFLHRRLSGQRLSPPCEELETSPLHQTHQMFFRMARMDLK